MKFLSLCIAALAAVATSKSCSKKCTSIVDLAQKDYSTFYAAFLQSNLEVANLEGATLFVPTNEAFNKIDPKVLEELLNDKEKLTNVLLNHVVIEEVIVKDGASFLSAIKQQLNIKDKHHNHQLFVNDAKIKSKNIKTCEGRANVIDSVLVPNPNPVPACTPILELAAGNADFSIFVAAFQASSLTADDLQNITAFVPNNAAFEALGQDTLNTLLQPKNKAQLTNVLLNHVVSGQFKVPESVGDLVLSSALDQSLNVVGDTFTVNNQTIIVPNIAVCEGLVNVIQGVLVPEACTDVLAAAKANEDLSTFVAAFSASTLTANDLKDAVVFAPSNSAFAALPNGTVETLLKPENVDQLNFVLLNHIVKGKFKLENKVYQTLAANSLNLTNVESCTTCNIRTCTGFVNLIETVLVPTPEGDCVNILDAARQNPDLSTFVAAFEASTIDPAALNQITAYVPTNDAFAKLPAGTVDTLLLPENVEILNNVLLNHVVRGQFINEIPANTTRFFISFAGNTLRATNDTIENVVFDARRNIKVCGGVVNVIENVLVPPPACTPVFDLADENSNLTTFKAAFIASGLDAAGLQNRTIFAPTDAAFAALPEGTVESLLLPENIGLLQKILLNHVATIPAELATVFPLTSLAEFNLTSVANNGTISINSIPVAAANVAVCEGFVNVIDGVLLPPQ